MDRQQKIKLSLATLVLFLVMIISLPALASESIEKSKELASAVTNDYNVAIGNSKAGVDGGSNNNVNGTGALAGGGNQNTAIGYSVQVVNGNLNSVDGVGALSGNGDGNTAIGMNAQAVEGDNNKALGYGALAGYGNYNTAIGQQTAAVYGSYNTAIGQQTTAGYGSGNIAVGNYANAGGSNLNTAIGFGAQATVGSSVALGAYSVADRPYSVSVGQPGYERKITNVAPGVYDTDAVNVGQLHNLGNRVDRLGSIAFAFSALAPMAYDPESPTQFSAGLGTYNGTTGFAVGVFHYTNPDLMFNAAIGMSSDNGWEKAARFGVTWRVGKRKQEPTLKLDVVTNEPAAAKPADDSIVSRVNRILASEDAQ